MTASEYAREYVVGNWDADQVAATATEGLAAEDRERIEDDETRPANLTVDDCANAIVALCRERVAPRAKRYKMFEDSGASKVIEADSLEEAMDEARDWATDGDYDERVMVEVWVRGLDDDGEETDEYDSDEVMAGPAPEPPDTECGDDDSDHNWTRPQELVGGCDSNPGVWATGGTSMEFHEVCAKCGLYRRTYSAGSQRNPGELEEQITYGRLGEDGQIEWIERVAPE